MVAAAPSGPVENDGLDPGPRAPGSRPRRLLVQAGAGPSSPPGKLHGLYVAEMFPVRKIADPDACSWGTRERLGAKPGFPPRHTPGGTGSYTSRLSQSGR